MEQEMINIVYDFIDEIKASNLYKQYKAKELEIKSSNDIQALSDTFKVWEDKYNEVKKYGRYHPDLKEVKQSFLKAKQALYTHTRVREFKRLEKELQSLLDGYGEAIVACVSKHLKLQGSLSFMHKGGSSCSVDKV